MNLLLAGSSGLVGSAVARVAARRGHRVTGVTGTHTGPLDGLAARLTLDLANPDATTRATLDLFPDAIINCAAVALPARCDADPVGSHALNVTLPATLARLAHHLGARFIHLSSEQVFDGQSSRPCAVTDTPSPINLYGRQKLESERLVAEAAPEFSAVLRPPLLVGNSSGGQRSPHEYLFSEWAAGRTPSVFTDEFRQPCSAEDLAEVIVELCERRDLRGLFHWAGTELVSRHELGRRIREHFKLTEREAPLRALSHAADPGATRQRPPRLALDLAPLAGLLKTPPRPLAAHLDTLEVPPPCREWYLRRA